MRFKGLDEPVVPDGPHFMKSLDIDHARDGEVMIAYAMNGEPLPLLNGFPLRLVVPGWFATYWVKMLTDIEVLAEPDDNFWTKKAYLIPDTPRADITPGQTGVSMIPINHMPPRSFVTNLASGAELPAGKPAELRGIAFGGNCGVAGVDVSIDGGHTWQPTELGRDGRQIRIPAMDHALRRACAGQRRHYGSLHQHERRRPSPARRTGTRSASCAT